MHYLERPRLGVMWAICGVIFAVGLSLMLYNGDLPLFIVGAALCYLSAFLTWSLYRDDLKRALKPLRRFRHLGLFPKEIVIVLFALFFAVALPTYLIAVRITNTPGGPASPLATQSLPGFSATAPLELRDVAAIRRQYLFDYETPEHARVSFYLSAKDHPTFAVLDVQGETYSVEAPLGAGGIPLNNMVFLTTEVGVSNNNAFLRILVDGKEIAHQELGFPIDLGSKKWSRGTLGADNNHQNNAAFRMGFWGFSHTTMDNDHLITHIKNVQNLVNTVGFDAATQKALTDTAPSEQSPDNLKVVFRFEDRKQIGSGPIDFDATFFNTGSRPAEIQAISVAVIATKMDPKKCCFLHQDYCDHFANMTGTFAANPAFNAQTGQGTKMNGTGDARWFWFPDAVKGTGPVTPGSIKVVSVKIGGVKLSPPFNEAVVCPMIRYSDADGVQKGAVCEGYAYATLLGAAQSTTATFGPEPGLPHRLLPHGDKADCEPIAVAK